MEGIPDPCGVAISTLDGSVFISSYSKRSVFKLSREGEYIGLLDVEGYVTGLEVSNQGEYLYACDPSRGLVYKLKIENGTLAATINCKKYVRSCYPEKICCSSDGFIYVSGRNMGKILVYDSSDTLVRCDDVKMYTTVTLDSKGLLHIFGSNMATVRNPMGDIEFTYNLKAYSYSGIVTRESYAVLSSQSYLLVYKAESDGKFLYSIGGFGDTCGIAMDRHGSLWVADRWKHCIFRIPEVFIPPFSPPSLLLLSHQMILLYLNEMPVASLPPRFARLYQESTQLVCVEVSSVDSALEKLNLLLRLKTKLPILLVEWIIQKRVQTQLLGRTECAILFVAEKSSPFTLKGESLLQPYQTDLVVGAKHIRNSSQD